MQGKILGLGNPLLDISAEVDDAFLKKYALVPKSYQFESKAQAGYYEELAARNGAQFIPGGATLNSVRVASGLLKSESCAYLGCLGDDEYGERMRKLCDDCKISAKFAISSGSKTGVCGVSVCQKERTLVTRIAAAREYPTSALSDSAAWKLVEGCNIVYSAGFFLDTNVAAMKSVAQHCAERGKLFATGLSAPLFVESYKDQMMEVFPYADVLFGNETEWEAFGEVHNLGAADLFEVARKAALFPKVNRNRPRVVVVTRGPDSTIVGEHVSGDEVTVYEVPVLPIKYEDILDTNAAGDAFAGGYLYGLACGMGTAGCVKFAHFAAHHILQRPGCSFHFKELPK
eukprot:Polyplicarium_translucidae@DN3346_c0_g5_i2.p1